MGVIRKKTVTRGGEGGVKYVCDVCSADITSTVRIRCAKDTVCVDYDLCVQCFANGDTSQKHDPADHPFRVIEQNSVPIYNPEWGADEEMMLLEGAEVYGLGSWADIADHIGGYRDKEEVAKHYYEVYDLTDDVEQQTKYFPLPKRANPHDMELFEQYPREEFQQNKKRRIEARKEAARNAPPPTPKLKAIVSTPACHEVQGYMPGRLEFETEFANEAEEAVQHMQFEPGDGLDANGNLEPEMELKLTVMDIYNSKLTARADRKKVIFEHNLLEYRKNAALDKKRTKEERDLLNKTKPFARMMNRLDYEALCADLVSELNLRQAIAQLQEWRLHRVTDLKTGEKYEQEKIQRLQKAQPMGSLDRERFATSARNKVIPPPENTSGSTKLLEEDYANEAVQILPHRGMNGPNGNAGSDTPNGIETKTNGLVNGHTNGILTPVSMKQKAVVSSLGGVAPLVMTAADTADLHLLTDEEKELCRVLRMHPKPYLLIKEQIMKEALRGNGQLKKKQAKEICRLETQKGSRIFDFFLNAGWIGKA